MKEHLKLDPTLKKNHNLIFTLGISKNRVTMLKFQETLPGNFDLLTQKLELWIKFFYCQTEASISMTSSALYSDIRV